MDQNVIYNIATHARVWVDGLLGRIKRTYKKSW